jgi:hypothetical protein
LCHPSFLPSFLPSFISSVLPSFLCTFLPSFLPEGGGGGGESEMTREGRVESHEDRSPHSRLPLSSPTSSLYLVGASQWREPEKCASAPGIICRGGMRMLSLLVHTHTNTHIYRYTHPYIDTCMHTKIHT